MSQYKEYGWNDAAVASHRYLYRDLVKLLSKRNQCILDIGCGNGSLDNCLLAKGYNVYGIDASEQGIIIADKGCSGKKRFFVCDIESGMLPDELRGIKFDTVISTEVIEHLYAPRDYIKFCKNILSNVEGGELIISTPYHGYFKNLMMSLLGQMDHHYHALWDGGHIKFWSKKTITKLLKEQGFEITEFKGSGRAVLLWKSMIIKCKL